jgi:aspartyl-tRNA(Asn)/glutamyl-tRNA(Gln) amidotransferase subunit B
MIGLEIHVQLRTESKLFCGCGTNSSEPNSACCEICLGMPGSKPMLNKKALIFALSAAKALNFTISKEMFFSRKTYFYPDLSKNFQITQFEVPLGLNGKIKLENKEIGLRRLHLEEDPASLVHSGTIQDSIFVLIDYNRSGIPLMEIVTEPEMENAEEARELLKSLRQIMEYLGIFDVDMCIIKADANVSIEESNFSRVEIKNISGFKDIVDAISYEIERQRKAFREEGVIRLETRGWNAEKRITESLRQKETEDDYGYIFDADLTPIIINEEIERSIINVELPQHRVKRFMLDFGIAKEDAEVICQDKEISRFFERVSAFADPVLASKWIRRELTRVMNKKGIKQPPQNAENFVKLMDLIKSTKITERTGQRIIEKIFDDGFNVEEHVQENNLSALPTDSGIDELCRKAVAENPSVVQDYKNGKQEALNFLVGQVMKATKGRADAKKLREIILGII